MYEPASVAQWANALAKPQCSEPGWLVQQGVGSTPAAAAGMSSQVSACYEIKFSGRCRGSAFILFQI